MPPFQVQVQRHMSYPACAHCAWKFLASCETPSPYKWYQHCGVYCCDLQAGVLIELRGSLLVGAQYLMDCHIAPGQFVAQVRISRNLGHLHNHNHNHQMASHSRVLATVLNSIHEITADCSSTTWSLHVYATAPCFVPHGAPHIPQKCQQGRRH